MNRIDKQLFRAAQRIGQQLAERRCEADLVALPQRQWTEVTKLVRSLELAQRRGWQHAAHRRQQDLVCELRRLERLLSDLNEQMEALSRRKSPATHGELYRDLVALREEFPQVDFDAGALELSVVTEPIELEGISLGRFDIRLSCDQLATARSYSVIALDPNPASTNSDVVHPHVNGSQLCEGDGGRAIGSALADGRLHDFFSIVNQTLHTYAEGRAFVELDMWDGFACHDCGHSMHEDERCICTACDETICLDCSRYCSRCDETFCWNCCGTCPRCDETVCPSCLGRCRGCGRRVCPDCLTENLCAECQKNEDDEHDDGDADLAETETTAAPDAAVHAASLGEVDIPS